jgi:hypothetical protein
MPLCNLGIRQTAVAMADCMRDNPSQRNCALIVGCTALGALNTTAALLAAKYGLASAGGSILGSSAVDAIVVESMVGGGAAFGCLSGSVTAGLCCVVNSCRSSNEQGEAISHQEPPQTPLPMRNHTDDYLDRVANLSAMTRPPEVTTTPRSERTSTLGEATTPRSGVRGSAVTTPRSGVRGSAVTTPRSGVRGSAATTPARVNDSYQTPLLNGQGPNETESKSFFRRIFSF